MARHIVDLSARSRILRAQRLLSHAWTASPAEVMAFLRDPRVELKKLGIRLPPACRVETVLQNHDWLSGHTDGLERQGTVTVLCRGDGDGETFYRVSLWANKAKDEPPERELLHPPDQEEKAFRSMSNLARIRIEAARRSMLASPLHLAVHRWMAPLTIKGPVTKSTDEAHRIFVGIKDVVARVLQQNPAMRTSLDEVAAVVARATHPAYSLLFRTQRAAATPMQIAFTSAMYAKALWLLRTSGWQLEALVGDVQQLLGDPAPALQLLADAVKSLDADFIPHVTVEATVRRQEDPALDAQLGEAERLFAQHSPAFPGPCPRFTAHGQGLSSHFAPTNAGEWWFLPGLIAFAISVWPESGATS